MLSLSFDRLVAALTLQCTLDVVWGAAVTWVAVDLVHTIDVSQTALLCCVIFVFLFFSFLSSFFPSHSFYVEDDLLFLRGTPCFFLRRVIGGSGITWSQVICLWNRLNKRKRLL